MRTHGRRILPWTRTSTGACSCGARAVALALRARAFTRCARGANFPRPARPYACPRSVVEEPTFLFEPSSLAMPLHLRARVTVVSEYKHTFEEPDGSGSEKSSKRRRERDNAPYVFLGLYAPSTPAMLQRTSAGIALWVFGCLCFVIPVFFNLFVYYRFVEARVGSRTRYDRTTAAWKMCVSAIIFTLFIVGCVALGAEAGTPTVRTRLGD